MTTLTSSPARRTRDSISRPGQRGLPAQGEALAGQCLATAFLVRGCERALYDLRCSIGQAGKSRDVRIGLQAAERLEEVLAGWRDTLRLLRATAEAEYLPREHHR